MSVPAKGTRVRDERAICALVPEIWAVGMEIAEKAPHRLLRFDGSSEMSVGEMRRPLQYIPSG